jgi:hypothetical protein
MTIDDRVIRLGVILVKHRKASQCCVADKSMGCRCIDGLVEDVGECVDDGDNVMKEGNVHLRNNLCRV